MFSSSGSFEGIFDSCSKSLCLEELSVLVNSYDIFKIIQMYLENSQATNKSGSDEVLSIT